MNNPYAKLSFLICTALLILFQIEISSAGSQNKIEDKKTGGIIGDPSHHRGFELGYDAGPRAGSEDKAQNKNSNPSMRPEYKKPGEFYRYEYGSRPLFIAGFRRGFMRGYQSAFGKIKLKQTEPTKTKVSDTFSNSKKTIIFAADAL